MSRTASPGLGIGAPVWAGAVAGTAWLGERLLDERGRWPLWLPVFLGLGVALYFSLPVEPPAWIGWSVVPVTALAGWAARRSAVALVTLVALGMVALGFAAAQVRTQWLAAPVLERPGAFVVTGLVESVELRAEGSQRVVLSRVSAETDGAPLPPRIRIGLRPDAQTVPVGERLNVRVLLTPPPQPVMPGAFDFARHAWFQEIGAVGRAIGPATILSRPDDLDGLAQARIALASFRQAVTARIVAVLPGDEGGVAAALITAETAAIPQKVLDEYRDSGLAHLLSISGLHMTLVAGLVFFIVRGVLALVPPIALRHPIKKWAAAVAIVATFGYMLMAGAPVPTQRAFLMTGIVLSAVLLDRQAISMRLVAWAALAILLLAPETLIGPSFQMSFAAVAALIAAYEVAAPRITAWRAARGNSWAMGVGLYLGGILFSTLIAGSATAVYGVFHFNRFSVFSMVANLLAVPITGMAVMPFALIGLLLMPFGLEHLALVPMGWGVAAVNMVAAEVASWPGAAVTLPILPVWGLALFTLGGAWLCLWRTAWRRWGVVAMVVGLASMTVERPPDILIEGRGQSFAVRLADGSLLVQKGGRILKETWDRRAGPLAEERWPKRSRSNDGRLSCDALGCVYRYQDRLIALVLDDDGIGPACSTADMVLSAVPVREACRSARLVVDRFDLWRRGAHAVWVAPDGRPRVETVRAWQGERPWSYKPTRRKKKKPAETESEPVEAEAGE